MYKTDEPRSDKGSILSMNTNIFNDLTLKDKILFNIGNNHILDYGDKSLRKTLSFFKDANINYVGAGMNFNSAFKPHIRKLMEKQYLSTQVQHQVKRFHQ